MGRRAMKQGTAGPGMPNRAVLRKNSAIATPQLQHRAHCGVLTSTEVEEVGFRVVAATPILHKVKLVQLENLLPTPGLPAALPPGRDLVVRPRGGRHGRR